MTFNFRPDEDGNLLLHTAVFQALGAASMCWSETPGGVFESERASEIGHALLDLIGERISEAIQ